MLTRVIVFRPENPSNNRIRSLASELIISWLSSSFSPTSFCFCFLAYSRKGCSVSSSHKKIFTASSVWHKVDSQLQNLSQKKNEVKRLCISLIRWSCSLMISYFALPHPKAYIPLPSTCHPVFCNQLFILGCYSLICNML